MPASLPLRHNPSTQFLSSPQIILSVLLNGAFVSDRSFTHKFSPIVLDILLSIVVSIHQKNVVIESLKLWIFQLELQTFALWFQLM